MTVEKARESIQSQKLLSPYIMTPRLQTQGGASKRAYLGKSLKQSKMVHSSRLLPSLQTTTNEIEEFKFASRSQERLRDVANTTHKQRN